LTVCREWHPEWLKVIWIGGRAHGGFPFEDQV
jgi:hypothetical protein